MPKLHSGCEGVSSWCSRVRSDAELANFIVVILAVEDLPLLRAFQDDLSLVGDLEAGGLVDARPPRSSSVLEDLTGFLADGIAIFHEADLVDLSERVGHGVRDLVKLVATYPHSTALYLRASSVFTFLNISAYWAPDLRISSE